MRSSAFLVAALVWAVPLAAQDAADPAVRTAQAEADRARRELDRAAAEAQARAAADQWRTNREESERLAANARLRAEADNARQQALAIEYERRRARSEGQLQAERAEAEHARRAAEQRVRWAEEELRRAEARPASEALSRPVPTQPDLLRRQAVEPLTAPRRRSMPQPGPEASPGAVIDMKEGVALCERDSGDRWRCNGPLRVAAGPIDARRTVPARACGADTVRDLGTIHGMRAFGCGFGIDPQSLAPGHRDVPALYRIDIPNRATFRCRQGSAGPCRER